LGENKVAKIVRLHAFGGPENLRIDDVAPVQPGPGEVRLRVEASGINRDHYTFMSGHQFRGHGFVQPEGSYPKLQGHFNWIRLLRHIVILKPMSRWEGILLFDFRNKLFSSRYSI